MTVTDYLERRWDTVLELTVDHLVVVLVAVLVATIIGVSLGALAHGRPWLSQLLVTTTSAMFTVPALAYFAVLVILVGLGFLPTLIALVIYALMPIVRNTVTGLAGVDTAIVKAATGMGMGRLQVMTRIELPLAWPVIFSGIRVSAVLTVGIAAIASYVGGPGLGAEIFGGLGALGSARAQAQATVGVVGVVIIAVLLDAVMAGLSRITTPKGLR
jgi:osmoprotectant transport system permease protein